MTLEELIYKRIAESAAAERLALHNGAPAVFFDNIGKPRLSGLYTNVVKSHLITVLRKALGNSAPHRAGANHGHLSNFHV